MNKPYTPSFLIIFFIELMSGIVIMTIGYLFLKRKDNTPIRVAIGEISAWIIISSFVSTAIQALNQNSEYYSYIFWMSLLVPYLLLSKDNAPKKIFVFCSAVLFNLLLVGFGMTISSVIYETTTIVHIDLVYLIMRLISSVLAVFIAYILMRDVFNASTVDINDDTWYLLSIYPIISIMAVILIFLPNSALAPESSLRVSFIIWFLVIIFGYWLVGRYVIILTDRFQTKKELEFVTKLLSMEKNYFEMLNSSLNKMRIIQHDMRHHVNALYALNQQGDREAINQYLLKMQDGLEKTAIMKLCSNDNINVIVSHYISRAEADNIKIDAHLSLPDKLNINITELTVIIGNSLENAFRAINEDTNSAQSRIIKLNCKYIDDKLIIVISNDYYGKLKTDENGNILSTKSNGGLGLKSIKAIAEKYNGDVVTHFENNVFSIYITLIDKIENKGEDNFNQ